jgi:DNA-binding transcriptional ArsR family regulator
MDFTNVNKAYQMVNEISHSRNKRVFQLLERDGEMTVQSIAARLQMGADQASQILMNLRKHNLVCFEREGHFVYYSVNVKEVYRLNEITSKLSQVKELVL